MKITLAIAEWKKKEKTKGKEKSGQKEEVVEQAPYNTVERMVGIYLLKYIKADNGGPMIKKEVMV